MINRNAIALVSESLPEKVLRSCRQVVRSLCPNASFACAGDAEMRIYLEACFSEEAGGFPCAVNGTLDAPPLRILTGHLDVEELWQLVSGRKRWKIGGENGREFVVGLAAQQVVLGLLHRVVGQGLPWGILTGVRPGRLWRELFLAGLASDERREVLARLYLVEDQKIDLLETVGAIQEPILKTWQGERFVAIYVSVPFCPSRCSYCSFPGFPAKPEDMEAYLDLLEEEIGFVARDIERFGLKVNAVYIGGGTPTVLQAEQLDRLLGSLGKALPMESVMEFCCEAGRPDTLSPEKLAVLAGVGVNRLCINPQSLNDVTLRQIGRCHTVADFYRAYELARRMGSWRINADMILGLPGEGAHQIQKTVEGLVGLGLDSITVHYLSLKRGSQMGDERAEVGDWRDTPFPAPDIPPPYQPYYMYRQKDILGNMENVGYALPDAYSLYNIVMIAESQNIVGLGAGASSKIITGPGIHKNLFHPKDIASYRKRMDENVAARRMLL